MPTKLPASLLIIAAGAVCGGIAYACTGGGYETNWDAQAASGYLSPANDTRSNFILLMADRYATEVADPAQMGTGIVPFEFPYAVMLERMSPPQARTASGENYESDRAAYGLSEDNNYFIYDSGNLGLCHTNRNGAAEFTAALNADPAVPAGEKPLLTSWRAALAKACDKAKDLRFDLGPVASLEGRAYAHYAEGARLFYADDLAAAAQQFESVGRPSSAWLSEAAAYMQFRAALAAAMKGSIDEWGGIAEPAKRDLAAIDRAEVARQHYLNAYSSGRFATSARNLERRIAWLRGDSTALGAAYSALLPAHPTSGTKPNIALIEEVDRRILPSNDGTGITDPILMAVTDLMRLRPTPEYDKERSCCGAELGQAELQRQRPIFAKEPDLFGYLVAAEVFFHRHQPSEVIALIPNAARQKRFSYTQFSRQMLRGFALEALHDRNVRSFWISLLPGTVQPYQRAAVELAIYNHDKAAGMVGKLLETGSPVLHPLIRQKILEDEAGPDLLRSQATAGISKQQRDVALYLLLAGDLHHGLYRDFLKDQLLVGKQPKRHDDGFYRWSFWSVGNYDPTFNPDLSPPPLSVFSTDGSNDLGVCADIGSTAASLAADPGAIRPRLCLAEFLRRKGFDQWNEVYDGNATVVRGRNHFRGPPLERMRIYQEVIASAAATPGDKAFALNRLVRCYQPSGFNSCGGGDVPVATRKAWFDKLKSDYSGTSWAKELKYYW